MDGSMHSQGVRLGADLGYGNAKMVAFDPATGETRTFVLPVGAGLATRAAKSMGDGSPVVGDGALVYVDGERWVAGVSPLDIQDFARPTHADYPKTKEYLALYYALLSKLGVDEIEHLVTGLPVSQFYAGKRDGSVDALSARLSGDHYIGPDRKVTVRRVTVVPQPAGAFADLVQVYRDLADDPDRSALTIDVGYYSTDFFLVRGGKVVDQCSGSTTDATSRIIEDATQQISHANRGVRLSPARLEAAIRDGRQTLALGTLTVEIEPFVSAAASRVAGNIVSKVFSSQRSLADMVDIVALAGGGGSLIEPAVRQAFPASRIALSKDPVLANARGFCYLARSATQGSGKKAA